MEGGGEGGMKRRGRDGEEREEGRGREGGRNRKEVRLKGKEVRDHVPSSACPAKTSSGLVGRPLSPSPDLRWWSPAPP